MNKLYEAVKIPYTAYQVFQDNSESDDLFVFDYGVNDMLKDVNPQSKKEDLLSFQKWYNCANIILCRGEPWAGEIVPDMFLFNYKFDLSRREFTQREYNQIKKTHPNIVISLPYNTMGYCEIWNPSNVETLSNFDAVKDQAPPLKGKRHNYKNSLLGIVPEFLWETDCSFIISEHHELVNTLLYYEILWMIHDLEGKKGVNPERFILSDLNLIDWDYRLEVFYEAFPRLERRVKSKGFNRFEALTSSFYSGQNHDIRYGIGRVPGQMNYDLTQRRKKKFLFLNRLGRDHRNALILKINQDNFLFSEADFYFSYGESKRFSFGPVTKKVVEEFSDLELDSMEDFVDKIPYFLDTSHTEVQRGEMIKPPNGGKNNPTYYGPTGDTLDILKYVKGSYFNLINETACNGSSIFLTEKTFKCFAWKQPFIIWGNPHSLRKLHELGYKTFHPWVDERYDDVIDTELRLKAVYREVKRICEMDLDEVHNLYQEMIPIIEHNYENFNYQNILRRNYDYVIREFLKS